MRLLYILPIFFLFSCTRVVSSPPVVIHDTSFVNIPIHDTVVVSSKRSGCDSVIRRLNSANLKLARIRFYYKICRKNPSQTKFLVSWIGRPLM